MRNSYLHLLDQSSPDCTVALLSPVAVAMVKTKPSVETFVLPNKLLMIKEQVRIMELSAAKISKLRRRNKGLHRYVMLRNLKRRMQLELVRDTTKFAEDLCSDNPSP